MDKGRSDRRVVRPHVAMADVMPWLEKKRVESDNDDALSQVYNGDKAKFPSVDSSDMPSSRATHIDARLQHQHTPLEGTTVDMDRDSNLHLSPLAGKALRFLTMPAGDF